MTVEILILGAGWTSTFLIPICQESHISYAATTRSGSSSTIKFEFDEDSENAAPYKLLPDANTVVITFPINKSGASERLVRLYKDTRSQAGCETAFIQLGSTSIWDGRRNKSNPSLANPIENKWYDRHSPFIPSDRANAETELLSLSPTVPTVVLNLAGLWGGSRSPKNWVGRVAPTKEALRDKGSLHLIHGIDVSRAILAVHLDMAKVAGERWILTDGRVYDWWDLASSWGGSPTPESAASDQYPSLPEGEHGPRVRWVFELMKEESIRALPRNHEVLGRALDSRDFWYKLGLSPIKPFLRG